VILQILGVHVGSALLAGVAAAVIRRRLAEMVGLEFWTVLLLPGLGLAMVIVSLILEAFFRRAIAPTDAAKLFDLGPRSAYRRDVPPPVEVLKRGIAAAPFEETLEIGGPAAIELALRRLSRAQTPSSMAALQKALRSADRDVRVRARGLLVRIEARLVQKAAAGEPEERGRAYESMARLSSGPTARQHLDAAAGCFRQALANRPESRVGLDLGRVLLLKKEWTAARQALTRHLLRYPTDAEARLARAEASFALSDAAGVREDCAALAGLGDRFRELVGRWVA